MKRPVALPYRFCYAEFKEKRQCFMRGYFVPSGIFLYGKNDQKVLIMSGIGHGFLTPPPSNLISAKLYCPYAPESIKFSLAFQGKPWYNTRQKWKKGSARVGSYANSFSTTNQPFRGHQAGIAECRHQVLRGYRHIHHPRAVALKRELPHCIYRIA